MRDRVVFKTLSVNLSFGILKALAIVAGVGE